MKSNIEKMKTTFFVILLLYAISLPAQIQDINNQSLDNSLRGEAEKLLTEWMDTLLTYQCVNLHSALDGGILCPACARIHGRIGDAVLPLMYLADKTGNDKYLHAAKSLMAWMENVHYPDGSWMNDVHVSDWNGTTVFAAIASMKLCIIMGIYWMTLPGIIGNSGWRRPVSLS